MSKDRKRMILLGVMIIVLFINWYNYKTVDFFFRGIIESIMEGLFQIFPSITILKKVSLFSKWVSMILLVVLNISISLTIIYIYFVEWKMVKQALRLLIIFSFICFIVILISYYQDNRVYLESSIFALKQLSTPLVECSLIPLLKLMNAEIAESET